jgi:hypothetical protein
MPKILDRLVSQLEAKGKSKKSAYAIATSQLQKSGNLKKGTNTPTAKGRRRGKMTAAQRAIDRASKISGRPKSDYVYNKKTNRAVLRRA